jgi:hypothetical protein
MKVLPINKKAADRFISLKHYSRKPSIFWAGFGLFENGLLSGVAVFGQPSPAIQKHAFKNRDFRLFELSRVVIQSPTRNAASFLISQALKLLAPRPCAVVSYADSAHGHCGIIYQATNWIYTGATKSHDHAYLIDGEKVHPMTLRDRGITSPKKWADENGVRTVAPEPKHRYFYLCGNRYETKKMRGSLSYPVAPSYPKTAYSRYDDGTPLIILETEATK